MKAHFGSIIVVSSVLVLSACSDETALNFTQPAGAFIDEGQFGNATMQNILAQTCRGRAKGYIAPDPIVVLDPDAANSPKSPQFGVSGGYRQGYVRCSGNLNGKYAEVIFQEYVDSATEIPPAAQTANVALDGG